MNIRGLKIVGRKAIVDLSRHADVMEDAIDNIKINEAMQSDEFIPWEEAKNSLEKKHGIHGLRNTDSKKSTKVPRRRS